jgi:malonyl-CoA O-methyltransferase
MLKVDLKESIKASFSAHALTYDLVASIHRRAASALFDRMRSDAKLFPDGPIMEIGCGTGNLSTLIDREYGDRQLVFVDLSDAMLEQCNIRLKAGSLNPRRNFIAADAEQLQLHPFFEQARFAAIASSFTFQWFTDVEHVVGRLLEFLLPGGRLYFSFPAQGSFPEWRHISCQSRLPFSANPLPQVSDLLTIAKHNGYQLDFEQLTLIDNFQDSYSFFSALKRLGAATQVDRDIHSASTLRKLMRQWDEISPDGIETTYRVVSGVLFK